MSPNQTMIYMDYAATTPVDQRVLDAMLPYFDQNFGNPSSVHRWGQKAEAAVENSREILAEGLHCLPEEIVFTSCGSESDNLALRGVAFAAKETRRANHILISPVEHPAVTKTALDLQKHYEFIVEKIPVDRYGQVDPDEVKARIRPETALVSIIYANNEIGTVNNLQEIGSLCRKQAVPLHTDAVQAAAYLPVNANELNVDLLSIGAHKFYGPKGVGALYVRKGTLLISAQTGGSQEFGLRAGTLNVPYIVGLGKAFQLAQLEREIRTSHVRSLRDRLINSVLEAIPGSMLTGHPTQRLPNHASFVFSGLDGNMLLLKLDASGFAVSSGSACKTGNPEPSDVLLALGLSPDQALGSLRITLGNSSTAADIEALMEIFPGMVDKERKLRSL